MVAKRTTRKTQSGGFGPLAQMGAQMGMELLGPLLSAGVGRLGQLIQTGKGRRRVGRPRKH